MKRQWISLLAGTLLLASLLAAPDIALAAARDGTALFIEVLLPSLLPYLVAGQLMAQPSFLTWCSRSMQKIMPGLFSLPGSSALALCISVASGYPAGARMTGELARQGSLSPSAARRTAQVASHAGPAFIVGSLGSAMLGDSRLGLLLWFCHVAASLMLAMLRGRFRRTSAEPVILIPDAGKPTVFADLLLALAKTLALVGSTVVFFSVILALLIHFGIMRALSGLLSPVFSFLGLSPQLIPAILSGMVEMTSGCRLAIQSGAPLSQVISVLAFLLGFGGLSIHMQSLSLLPGVPFKGFIAHKMIQALTSMLLTRAVFSIFSTAKPVFLPSSIHYAPMGFTQLMVLAGFMLAVILIFYLLLALIAHFVKD